MDEAKAIEIAEAADLVLNGYAVTREGDSFNVVNLHTGKAASILKSGELGETDMDGVESDIAIRIVTENRRYIKSPSVVAKGDTSHRLT